MGTHIKLHEKEKSILKLEEESLRDLIFQYQSALNALKVEELTLTNRIGQSLDRARTSQGNTPTASHTTRPVTALGNLPTLISKIDEAENICRPSPLHSTAANINEKLLNLNPSFLNTEMFTADDEFEMWKS